MEEKETVARDCLPSEPQAAGIRLEKIAGSIPFLLHFAVQSVLNVDVEVEEPETSANHTTPCCMSRDL